MKYYTSIPNFLFDTYLPKLKPSEFMILMVIARQTYGWYDPKRKSHKKRDWISNSLFHEKTNLSLKTISVVIDNLTLMGIVRSSNSMDIEIDKEQRKQAHKVFYEIVEESLASRLVKVSEEAKENIQFKTDAERVEEILAKKNFPNVPPNA